MKVSPVTVAGDILGNVVNVSQNNSEYGYIRVQQVVTSFSETGWLKVSKRSALLKGKVEELTALDLRVDNELPGKIVVKESHEPFNPQTPDRDLKIAGDTGIVCRVGDQPIYRQTFYTQDVNAEDTLIMHDNTEEIKEALRAMKEVKVLSTPTTEKEVF